MSLITLHFITGNRHKAEELQSIFPTLEQVEIDLPEIQTVDSREVINYKLIEGRKRLPDGAIVVEDTALHLECLNGFPGALIKWLLSSIGCDAIYDLCTKMGDLRAKACTVIGYLGEGEETPRFFDASLSGKIASPRGSHGFGWDPIFIPEGSNKTLAELDPADLQAVKMRRLAAEELARYLSEHSRF